MRSLSVLPPSPGGLWPGALDRCDHDGRAGGSGTPCVACSRIGASVGVRAGSPHVRCERGRRGKIPHGAFGGHTARMGATAVRPLERVRARGWPVIGESDSDLVARVRSGDEGAFEAIYDRYHRGLLAFCRHMLGGRHDAEDALQLSLVSAYRALGNGSDVDINLKPWLYTIARNRCLSMLRARRDERLGDDAADADRAFDGLADEVQRRSDLRDLVRELQRLPED